MLVAYIRSVLWGAILLLGGLAAPAHAVTVISGAQADASVPIGICGAFSTVQGNAITLIGNERGGSGIPGGLSSDGMTWFTFLGESGTNDRIAVNGTTGNTPTRNFAVTKYTGSATDPAPPLSLAVDPISNRVHLLQTYQTAGCGGSPPCQANQVTTGNFADTGAIQNFTTFNNSGAGSFTFADTNTVYESFQTSTGGAGVVLRRIDGSTGATSASIKTSTYTASSPITTNAASLFQFNSTTIYQYNKLATPITLAASLNLGFALNVNALAASLVGVWVERATFVDFCQVNLPAFTGCSSTYTWTPATEGARTLWFGFDAVNSRLYVLRTDTATDTVVAFLHRFTVSPLVKENTTALTFTVDHTPQPNSVAFSVPKQRLTWIGSRGSNAFNATVNTVGVCSNITG